MMNTRYFVTYWVIFTTLLISGCNKEQDKTLRIYAGAGMRRAVDALITAFEKKTGIGVDPDYGGSGMIISRAKEDSDADLFMPGDVWYVNRLDELTGFIETKTPVSYFVPTIIVKKGNPKKITGLHDFSRDDIKVALGKPKACQIGRLSAKIFNKAGMNSADFDAKESLTVNELGVWVKMNNVDASIVWDAIAVNIADDVETITIPAQQNIISNVVIGLMKTSKRKPAAQRFINFITRPDGQNILKEKGYRTSL